MTIDFYQMMASNPCRAVTFTAQHLGIKLNEIYVDLFTDEQLKPEFVKLNPQHKIPVIVDDGFQLNESRAIQAYLVNKYAPNHAIYPEDPQKRAAIDRMLYFDATLNIALMDIVIPLWRKKTPKPEHFEALKKQLNFLEEILGKTSYAAADYITLADFALVADIAHIGVFDFDLSGYPRITAWIQKLKNEIPNYHEINEVPIVQYREHLKSLQ